MAEHSFAPLKDRVLVIPLSCDNSRSLTPVRILHAHVSQVEKIDKFVNNIGRFVGTNQSGFSDDWKIDSYKILPTSTDEYTGIVIVYYANNKEGKLPAINSSTDLVGDSLL